MLAHLLKLRTSHVVAEAAPAVIETNDLGENAASQFAAGFLYGWTEGTVDERDYIVGCARDSWIVDSQLEQAWDAYAAGDYAWGNDHINSAQPSWVASMVLCPKVYTDFLRIVAYKEKFFGRDDWEDVARANYQASKDYVDNQWAQALLTWE